MINTKAILDFLYWNKFIPLFDELEDLEGITLVDSEIYDFNDTIYGH